MLLNVMLLVAMLLVLKLLAEVLLGMLLNVMLLIAMLLVLKLLAEELLVGMLLNVMLLIVMLLIITMRLVWCCDDANDVEGFDGAGRNAACRCDDCTRKLDAGHRAFSIRVFEGAG